MGTIDITPVNLPGIDLPIAASTPRSARRVTQTTDPTKAIHVMFEAPGRCPNERRTHNVITDLSPSMGRPGVAGNDATALRHTAVLAAAQRMARSCRCHHEMLQLFSLDLQGDFDVGPVELNRHGIGAITAALTSPNYGYGCSVLGPALTAAAAAVSDEETITTLTVLSDFQLFDMGSIDLLATFPAVSIHAVVLSAPVPAQLTAPDNVTITAVGPASDPAEIALVVYDQLRSGRRTSRRDSRNGGQK